jgi:GH24 family phage-related lysozyme (muramidase)
MPTGPNAHMTLSMGGENMIKEAEAPKGKPYLKAYDDGTGTPTIGYGSTKGVTMGMKITVQDLGNQVMTPMQPYLRSPAFQSQIPGVTAGAFEEQ